MVTRKRPPTPKASNNDLMPTDARRLTLPVLTIIALVGFFMWIAWSAAIERESIKGKLEVVDNSLVGIQRQYDNLVTIIKNYADRAKETWSLQDHEIWCLRAQINNADWKCPNEPMRPGELDRPALRIAPPPIQHKEKRSSFPKNNGLH